MCGRFSLSTSVNQLRKLFELEMMEEIQPRYNIAPTQKSLDQVQNCV
jgi:putative SOS response-associated peptidase YedK